MTDDILLIIMSQQYFTNCALADILRQLILVNSNNGIDVGQYVENFKSLSSQLDDFNDTISRLTKSKVSNQSSPKKCVGTWIYGKPLYRKCYHITTPNT